MLVYITCFASLIVMTFSSSLLTFWLVGEVMSLIVIYRLLLNTKDTSSSDVIQFMFINFRMSLILFTGIISDNSTLIVLGLWGKLRLSPIHTPTMAIVANVPSSKVMMFFILPKLPYLIMSGVIPTWTFIVPVLALLLIRRDINVSESVGYCLVVSSTTSALIFSVSTTWGILIYTLSIFWRMLVYYTDHTTLTESSSRVHLNLLLPVPGSYSWVMKISVAQIAQLPLMSMIVVILLSVMPAWYVIKFFLQHTNNAYGATKHLRKSQSLWLIIMIVNVLLIWIL